MGEKLMHATFLRRIIENVGSDKVVHVGLRALCKEELAFIEKNHVKHFSMPDLKRHEVKEDARLIRQAVSDFAKLYVTVDMDAFDPGFAPGVGNPEPDGMWPDLFFTILTRLCDERLAGVCWLPFHLVPCAGLKPERERGWPVHYYVYPEYLQRV